MTEGFSLYSFMKFAILRERQIRGGERVTANRNMLRKLWKCDTMSSIMD